MAEEKYKKGNELLGQDFLGDMQRNVDSMPTTGLFDKLAKLGAQQRLQPIADQKRFESSYKPLLKMVEDAEKRVTDGMQAYKDAYPDFDDSKLHGGVGDLITGTMTENNARFKELNRQLAYMSPRNPKYADTVSEIEKIEKSIVSLRDDNLKLMEIKNSINTGNLKLKNISKGNEPGLKNMYSDIQQGISDNFQNIDGKMYWVDPNPDLSDDDPYKKVSVESIKAGAPAMTNGAARDEHNDIMNNIVDIPIDSPNYQENLNYAVGIMFEKIEDDGVKSLIFDSENSKNEPYSKGLNMFNTADWFEEFYREANVASGDVIDVRRDIQRNGVDYDVNGVNVLNHFKNWYITKLDSLPKSDKGKPKPVTNLDDFPGEEESGGNGGEGSDVTPIPIDITEIAPPKIEGTEIYQGQTGSGKNFGNSKSPFAGITQYGWAPGTDPENRKMGAKDTLFDYGTTFGGFGKDNEFVPNTLEREYGKYGFSFKNVGAGSDSEFNEFFSGDVLEVTYDHPTLGPKIERFEFDNNTKDEDEKQAKLLQEFMERMIGFSSGK
jgi:hypothetical protein